jgi:hypothetical protein
MNQEPNANTAAAAAAAIAVLAAPHPVVAYTQPLAQTRDPATTSSYILLSSIASVVNHLNIPPVEGIDELASWMYWHSATPSTERSG